MADITFQTLIEANQLIKATPIQNKNYAEVPQRVKAFRYAFPDGSIETEMISNDGGVCIFKATAKDGSGKILGTGTAYEKEGAGFINKTSYIENCETSAVGRALGFCGLGIDSSISSFEEVSNAKLQQKQSEEIKPVKEADPQKDLVDEAELKAKVIGYINRHQMSAENIAKICKCYKVEDLQHLTADHCKHYIATLQKNGGSIDK